MGTTVFPRLRSNSFWTRMPRCGLTGVIASWSQRATMDRLKRRIRICPAEIPGIVLGPSRLSFLRSMLGTSIHRTQHRRSGVTNDGSGVGGVVTGFVYGLLWVLTRAIGWVFFRYRAEGQIPPTGGVLVAANHASYLDIPLLGCGMTRRAWYIGRNDLFPFPMLNGILQSLGWIPLRPGRLDREAFNKAISLIQAGKVVVIFPEGGRTHDGHLRPT